MEKLSDLLEMAKVSDIIATKKEKDAIDKVLDYDEIREKYFPVLSDHRSDRSSCRNRICGI